jgi:Amt family ammonium transporter
VDDTLGVIYTHGIAGLTGGLLVGVFANAKVIEYIGAGGASDLPGKNGIIHGSWTLLRWQAEAGAWVVVFSGVMTFILLKIVGIFMPLRLSDEELEIGDHAIHGNEVYPSDIPTLGGPHAPAWQPGGGGAVPAGAGA